MLHSSCSKRELKLIDAMLMVKLWIYPLLSDILTPFEGHLALELAPDSRVPPRTIFYERFEVLIRAGA